MTNSEIENRRTLVDECLQRISSGDADAGLDLARIFLGDLPSSEAHIPISVVEALVRQSAQLVSSDAQDYLQDLWPQMKKVSMKRLSRRGLAEQE